ncbi:MAG: hypothetical protein ACM3TR_17175 [Caulobacteraceae bacterium]
MQQNNYSGELEDKLNDVSLYGEFMATFNYWVSSEEQKKRVEHLQDIGRIDRISH